MAMRSDGLRTKKRVLSACVRLFLESGYQGTILTTIYGEAKVSASSFQNLFRNKEGVLTEITQYMFENEYQIVRNILDENLAPVLVYTAEAAIQLTLTELNESLRDMYVESYTLKDTLGVIQRSIVGELHSIFGSYQPALTEEDFLHLTLGTTGLMRGYMAFPCSENFPLEQKLRCFLDASLRAFHVPDEEIEQALDYVSRLDIRGISKIVMEKLFRQLAVHYDFSLSGLLPEK